MKIKGLATCRCQCTNMPGAMVPAPPPKDFERHVDVGLPSPALQLPPTRLLSCRDILASPLTVAADGDWRFRIVSGMVTITICLSCFYYNQTKLRVSSDTVLVFLQFRKRWMRSGICLSRTPQPYMCPSSNPEGLDGL